MVLALALDVEVHGDGQGDDVDQEQPFSQRQVQGVHPGTEEQVLDHGNEANDGQGYEEEENVPDDGGAQVPSQFVAFVGSRTLHFTRKEVGEDLLSYEVAYVAAPLGLLLTPFSLLLIYFHLLEVVLGTTLEIIVAVVGLLGVLAPSLQIIVILNPKFFTLRCNLQGTYAGGRIARVLLDVRG